MHKVNIFLYDEIVRHTRDVYWNVAPVSGNAGRRRGLCGHMAQVRGFR